MMNNAADMSPDASPDTPNPRSGVRRVNNIPVYLIGGVIAGFLLVMALVAANRAEKQQRPPEASEQKATSTDMFANELAGQAKDGLVPPAKVGPPEVPSLPAGDPPIPMVRPGTLETPPAPPPMAAAQAGSQDPDPRARIAEQKMHMLEEAAHARTNVQVVAPRSTGSAPADFQKTGSATISREDAIARIAAARQQEISITADDPTAVYQARLQQLQAAGIAAPATAGAAVPVSAATEQAEQPGTPTGKNYAQFQGRPLQDRWRLDSQLQAPRSPL